MEIDVQLAVKVFQQELPQARAGHEVRVTQGQHGGQFVRHGRLAATPLIKLAPLHRAAALHNVEQREGARTLRGSFRVHRRSGGSKKPASSVDGSWSLSSNFKS